MTVDIDRTISDFLKRFGSDRNIDIPYLDDKGVAHLQRGSAVVTLQVMKDRGLLLLLSRIMPAPNSGGEDLYRHLLELSFVETGSAAFAIRRDTGEVYLRSLRKLEGLDYSEFESMVEEIAAVSDEWDDRLHAEYGAQMVDSGD